MAKFNTVGFDEVEKLFLHQIEIATKAVPLMLRAGADVIVKAQQAEAQAMGIRRTGDFIGSIGIYKEYIRDTSSAIIIAPKGKDRKGVSNTEKGFIAEYGLKKGHTGTGKNASTGKRHRVRNWRKISNRNQAARPWMATANEKIEEKVHQVMREVWEDMNNGN